MINMKNELLWKPTSKRIESTSLFQFIKHVNTKHKEKIDCFDALHNGLLKTETIFGMKFGIFMMLLVKKVKIHI